LARIERAKPVSFCLALQAVFSLQAGSSFIQFWRCLAEVALALSTGSALRSATVWQAYADG